MTAIDPQVALDKLQHRMNNMLQMVSSLLARQARASDGLASQILRKAEAQLEAFALLNRALRDSAVDGVEGRPCAGAYLTALCGHLDRACLSPAGIALETVLEMPLPVDGACCRALGLIATELVLNAAKHAFAERQGGNVGVLLTRLAEPPRIVLGVMDNGCGLDAACQAGTGQGLGFVRMLAASVKGDCEVLTGSTGTRVAITAPMPA